jgi:hypothetical protein
MALRDQVRFRQHPGMRRYLLVTIGVFVASCAPPTPRDGDARPVGAATTSTTIDIDATPLDERVPVGIDVDRDGLDDVLENRVARDYLPFLANHPDDECPLSGIVFRARPHPDDATLINVIYSRLYEKDCGLTAHVGDNEAFGTTVDPSLPAPEGLLAIVAVSHQNTACQRTTTCGRCGDVNACELADDGRPVLFASNGKHAGAVDRERGCGLMSCFDSCEMNEVSASPPMLNAGEPEAPLVNDLTEDGFIDASRGWTAQEVFHYDPWGGAEFGSAGIVADDLVDETFVPPACR